MNEYTPLVSWETFITDLLPVQGEDFYYTCKVASTDPNDYSPNELGEVGTSETTKTDRFYIVDYLGKIYRIDQVLDETTGEIKIYDLTEDTIDGPYLGKNAYVYQAKEYRNVLTQAQRKRLHPTAYDMILNIENNVLQVAGSYDYIDFNTEIDNPDYTEGRVFYNSTENTLSYYNDETLVNLNNHDGLYVGLTGNETVAGIKIFSSFPITPSSVPSSDYQVVNKKYVDDAVVGYSWIVASVVAATTENITISTALNDGDTLDGVTLSTGEYILVKDQTTKSQNGLYEVGTTPARVAEMDAAGEFKSKAMLVTTGTINGGSSWVCVSTVVTVDTDDVEFSKLSQSVAYIAGTGIDITGQTISVDMTDFDTDNLTEGTTNLYSQWSTSGDNIYYNTGNVGIGTDEIDTILHIQGVEPILTLESTSAYSAIPTVEINSRLIYNSTGSITNFGKIVFSKNNATNADTGGFTAFYKKPNGATTSEAIRIDPDGNVGINTTSPKGILDIFGDSGSDGLMLSSSSENTSSPYIVFADNNGSNIGASIQGFYDTDGYGKKGLSFSVGGADDWVSEISDLTEALRIKTNGNILIGTTTDSGYKLDVNGTGRYTGALKIGAYTLPNTDGTKAQVLQTNGSGTVSWGTVSSGKSPLTTKGDLYTYSTADVRLPIGTDGYILTADSTETTGMKWKDSNANITKVCRFEILYTNKTRTNIITLPENALIFDIGIEEITPFNGSGGNGLSIGTSDNDSKFMYQNLAVLSFTDRIDPGFGASYSIPYRCIESTTITILYENSNNDSTAGNAIVYIHYVTF